MHYVFQFGVVLDNLPALLHGALLTIRLSSLAMLFGSALGLRLRADEAALLAMTINLGAYATEIVRGGIEAIPFGQIEAARALGLRRGHIFRFIVVKPALRIVYPALVSQFILLMLGSSVVSSISAVDLTAVTNTLQSTTFRAFEFYFATTLIYLVMALGFRLLLDALGWALLTRRQA